MIGKEYSNGEKKKWIEKRRRENETGRKMKRVNMKERAPLRLCCRMQRIMSSFLKKSFILRETTLY